MTTTEPTTTDVDRDRADPRPARVSLLDRLRSGELRSAWTFAGQGGDPFEELVSLLRDRPALAEPLGRMSRVLDGLASTPEVRAEGVLAEGLDLAAWVDLPDDAPDAAYRRRTAVACPLVFATQVLIWRSALDDGLSDVAPTAVGGHSQGLLTALMVAEDPSGTPDDERVERYLTIALREGLFLARARRAGGSPMVAVNGPRPQRMADLVAEVNATLSPDAPPAVLALRNSPTRHVIAGDPAVLAMVRAHLDSVRLREAEDRRKGRRGGAPLQFSWNELPVEVPFHTPALAGVADDFRSWLRQSELLPDPDTLRVAVLATDDGTDVRNRVADGGSPALADLLVAAHFTDPVRWDLVAEGLDSSGADWVLDLGPGTEIARLTAENLRGTGRRVVALSSPEGRRVLSTPGVAPRDPDLRHDDAAPGVVELPDGRRHVDNRYTRATGRPPVILAGMTPTTVDVPIVAAAANAGFAAELAGGGQPSQVILTERLAELGESLEPGVEVAFNTLLLDRHLWDLHIERDRLVERARAGGSPINGVTVSAGVPEPDEAVALLDRWAAAGMTANAFKCGTVEQIRQVLAIAERAPHHRIQLHLEGGKAGGHHSWEDLDEVLLAAYHEVRLRSSVLLCVGGGISTPERAAALIDGSWAERHGERAMPVDAVLLGTVAMATAESTATSGVKAALVAAEGTADWVPRRGTNGGVSSTSSSLRADIHTLANAGNVAANLVDELGSDAERIAARHDEIVEVLSRTAKPWFGNLDEMTYGGLLDRFVELCAIGRNRRYDDGRWLDASWRRRALALFRRASARLSESDRGTVEAPVAVGADLDDPAGALARFRSAHPDADATLLHPADVDHFLETCAGGGKPVPFVPVIDTELRRWYLADALWQAQDDRYPADAVIVIPGPEAVSGITRVDEPVADLLHRFEAGIVATLTTTSATVVRRDRLSREGSAPAPLKAVAGAGQGVLAAACAAASVVECDRTVPNPLHSLVRAGDAVAVTREGDIPVAVTITPTGEVSAGDAVHVVVDTTDGPEPDEVRIVVETPRVRGGRDRDEMTLVPIDATGARFECRRDVDRRRDIQRDVLLGGSPGDQVDGWQVDDGTIRAHGAATGATHGGVSTDLVFSLAWPSLVRLLTSGRLTEGVDDLVHTEHRVVVGPAWPPAPGDRGRSDIRVTEVVDDDRSRQVTTVTTLSTDGGAHLATLVTGLAVARPHQPIGGRRTERRLRGIEHRAIEHGGIEHGGIERGTNDRADLVEVTTETHRSPGLLRHCAEGAIVFDRVVLTDELLGATTSLPEHPVEVDWELRIADGELVDPHALPGTGADRPHRRFATAHDRAPLDMSTFAAAAGDHNPLHRSLLAARRAGLERPIVHGMWTSARAAAFVVETQCDGDAARLVDWHIRFLAPVALGADIAMVATRSGQRDGALVLGVEVRADDIPCATATAVVAPARTVWCYPGQGVQHRGMGADGRSRSTVARSVWERADRCTRERLGFSIVDVVEQNPTTLRLADGTVRRHPSGVLFLTEFTQVALTTLAAAQTAELRADAAVSDPDLACGHSAGEFNALVALGVLELEPTLELMYRRGRAMQEHVPRDDLGASPYRLAVIDPSRADLDEAAMHAAVAAVGAERDEMLEVVNLNAAGRQYSVVGTSGGLDQLSAALGGRALKVVPGIDVPFHSSVLAPAVDQFRSDLEALVPDHVDHRRLVGRWVPNVWGRTLTSDDLAIATDADADTGETARDDAARSLLIDLLATQLASPVQWIATLDTLVRPTVAGGEGVGRMIEIGPSESPVLTQLARDLAGVEIIHAEIDREALTATDTEPEPVDDDGEPETVEGGTHVVPAATAPVPASPASPVTSDVADRPVDAGDALLLVLAVQARVRADQIDRSETIEELFQGASSRRNQVLVDLGRELGLSGVDGAHEQPIGTLADDLRAGGARYRFPGPYLRDTVASGLGRTLGASGLSRRDLSTLVADRYGLGPGWADRVAAAIALGTRQGPSARGDALGEWAELPLGSPADARALVDRAVTDVAGRLGVAVSAVAEGTVSTVDAAAVAAATGRVEHALDQSARQLIRSLGGSLHESGDPLPDADEDRGRLDVLDRELGADRAAAVEARFDARRHVRFAAATAMARWDLIALWHAALDERISDDAVFSDLARLARFHVDPTFVDTATWLSSRAEHHGSNELAKALRRAADGMVEAAGTAYRPDEGLVDVLRGTGLTALTDLAVANAAEPGPADVSDEIALVTGASPGSIAAELVGQLLSGGATVVATSSSLTLERRRWFRELYRRHAGPGAELHLLPANLASFGDIDGLLDWLDEPTVPQRSRPDLQIGPLLPTLVAPFAATPTLGSAADAGVRSETAIRVQLLGVERLVAGIGERVRDRRPDLPAHVVLPLSPNHGVIGGDGPYAETKAGLEVLLHRRASEATTWGDGVVLSGARIGWVRGTGLTAAADSLADAFDATDGLRTFRTDEMGWLLGTLCRPEWRDHLRTRGSALVDLTGGFDAAAANGPLAPAANGATADPAVTVDGSDERARARARIVAERCDSVRPRITALPRPETVVTGRPAAATGAGGPDPTLPTPAPGVTPADLVVIVGAAELGPCGTSPTRDQIERDDALTPDGVAELAWACGLVRYQRDGYRGRWIDAATDTEVPEEELFERYAETVGARVGLRPLEVDGVVEPDGFPELRLVHLDRDVSFEVASEADARSFVADDPEHTDARLDPETGEWRVIRRAGASVRVPHRTDASRRVAGQFPSGIELTRFGLPSAMATTTDRMALINLICTDEAFTAAGLDPEELMGAVHPAMVANTQGSGMGGLTSIRRLLLDQLLGEERQTDRLQEALINVVAAHAVQGYVGSYGSMVHPVAACATAAVSLEEAHDKIRSGKALAVLAGGFDDLTPEGMLGFGDMGATVSSDDLDAMGIMPCEASRANDLRRRGFVESQGGGSFLVMRGDVALGLGLPVRGVLAYAATFGDGIHTSIPAPGMGALASAMGGPKSPLATALARHGLTPDDIAVVSKHDTSTEMNDPNEADLHHRIQDAIGRTAGNPLMVVSQKTVTGHAKGGAAAWQVAGVLQMMETGIVPGNRTLESADPLLAASTHLAVGHRTVQRAEAEPIRAALVTSLGFGHVSALLAVAHPDVFLAAVPEADREDYVARAARRRATGRRRLLERRLGRGRPIRRTERRVGGTGDTRSDPVAEREAEAALLLDPDIRLGADGRYR